MDQPTKNWTTSISQQKRQQLDAYLQDLISLPTAIIDSQCVKRFLTLKGSDIETFIEMEFDSSEMILDLIGDYLETDEIKFTAVIGQKVAHWNIKEFCGYDELVRDIEQRMNEYVPCLCYEDECMELITLYGDNDLRLLLRTRKSLSLFVVEKE